MPRGHMLAMITSPNWEAMTRWLGNIDAREKEVSTEALKVIAAQFLAETQYRSPYWTGHLRMHHTSFVKDYGYEEVLGIVAIDPGAPEHPILGGRPSDYGHRLHEEGRPWFARTIMEAGHQIMQRNLSLFMSIYTYQDYGRYEFAA
jgi:hypothetical protein